jgi:hypothetical protein
MTLKVEKMETCAFYRVNGTEISTREVKKTECKVPVVTAESDFQQNC